MIQRKNKKIKKKLFTKIKSLFINTNIGEETKLSYIIGSYIYTIYRILKDNLIIFKFGLGRIIVGFYLSLTFIVH